MVLSTYLKWGSFFLLSHNQWMIFSWKSQVSSIFIVIPHFSDSKYFWQQAADRTGYGSNATGSAEGLKFALIKLPVRNNNSDLRFNSISIFHITGFSAGILLSSEHFIFFWNISWFVSVCRLRLTLLKSTDTVICFDFLISSGRARATHTHYALQYRLSVWDRLLALKCRTLEFEANSNAAWHFLGL